MTALAPVCHQVQKCPNFPKERPQTKHVKVDPADKLHQLATKQLSTLHQQKIIAKQFPKSENLSLKNSRHTFSRALISAKRVWASSLKNVKDV